MSQEVAKKAAASAAIEIIEPGMKLGLGTGSTSKYFIELLGKKCKEGLKIEAAATSRESERLAEQEGIPILSMENLTELDLTVDGADEIDSEMTLIKGAGGALVREKIIATMSAQMIVIADATKQVDRLGRGPLPVEVIPFGAFATKHQLEQLGCEASFRNDSNGSPFVTDNHNWILDIQLPEDLDSFEEAHIQILCLPGVVETGFFFHLATKVVIGKPDGTTELLT